MSFLLILSQCRGKNNYFYCNNTPTMSRPMWLKEFMKGLPLLKIEHSNYNLFC